MISTKEENLRFLLKTDKQLEKSNFSSYDVSVSENGSFIIGDIYKENTTIDEIHKVIGSVDDEKILVLLLKRYQIIINDGEQGYGAVQNLLSPNFNADDFCMSKCSFFVDKTDTYSVELNYNFEDELNVEVSKFVENDEEIARFSESARSILQDIIEGLEVSLQ